jgi:hypothetical protein
MALSQRKVAEANLLQLSIFERVCSTWSGGVSYNKGESNLFS